MAEIAINYIDPFTVATTDKSVSWFHLRRAYASYKVDLKVANDPQVPISVITRNDKDGGKWRWDTELFLKEVAVLTDKIQASGAFEAIWLKKEDGVYTVLDGHHRLVSWQQLGNTSIPAVVVTVTTHKSLYG